MHNVTVLNVMLLPLITPFNRNVFMFNCAVSNVIFFTYIYTIFNGMLLRIITPFEMKGFNAQIYHF